MSPLPRRTALITGVNGISGNAIVEHLIRQPRSEWVKIVVTSRKPLPQSWQDDRVEFFALDLLWPQDKIIAAMKPYCSEVTHAFFASYVHTDDFTLLTKYNVPLWENFLEEASRYDDKGENFYYKQEDFMFARQKEAAARGHNWHYSIIRPNGIVGFTPAANGMSEAITMALYFLISKELGQNAEFPGNDYFYNCVDDASSAKGIANISVWAMTQEHTKDEAFNSVNGDTYVWKYFWPRIAAYFGAEVSAFARFHGNNEAYLSSRQRILNLFEEPRKVARR
ncbi:hypothetical protein SLS59_008976 [Nothophoma quercina]|uniref:PRISE-like Rossmann-fold domain-containing protein n=1 Tax=Nothophoma quercina TaxID=749835 RepID=A0ABR3QPQ3_9PLEO